MSIDRRLFLGGAGATIGLGASGLAGAAPRDGKTPITRAEWDALVRGEMSGELTCVSTSEYTEGPFYYESSQRRAALAEGHSGESLRLRITLGGLGMAGHCRPLQGAVVDVWQCDAAGLYSNVGPDIQYQDTTGQTFLRGHQLTDANGQVEFETIVPGWELVPAATPIGVAMRTTHIHVKAFHGRELITTQLFFPDALIDGLYATTEPYKSHRMLTGPGLDRHYERIRNGEDRFYLEADSKPMQVARGADGVLVASATIGMLSPGDRGLETLFR
jgi:protocatechuate 3,4-dioxygenase beta subunit